VGLAPPPRCAHCTSTLRLANSIATLEQLWRRARSAGGEQMEMPVLLIGRDEDQHELIERARIRRLGTDSVHMQLSGENQLRAAVDGEGRIQGAASGSGDMRVVRLR
jgi:hypothetical protein